LNEILGYYLKIGHNLPNLSFTAIQQTMMQLRDITEQKIEGIRGSNPGSFLRSSLQTEGDEDVRVDSRAPY
jgi:hypothetical protein